MSLGTWINGVPSGVSPAVDQEDLKNNNITLANTYAVDHTQLGASSGAGTHGDVRFLPIPVPTQGAYWQFFVNQSNSLPCLLPPTGQGVVPQVMISTAAAVGANGNYWQYTVNPSATLTVLVTIICPLGANLVYVSVVFTSTVADSTINRVFIPFKDASNNQIQLGQPIAGSGAAGYSVVWNIVNTVAPGSPPTTLGTPNIIYRDGLWVPAYFSNPLYLSQGAVATLLG